jgi:MerR family transcriptional regulator, glutamine synthetase repressor
MSYCITFLRMMTKRSMKNPAASDGESRLNAKNYTMAVTVKLAGVEAHRIRRYEEGGLLSPERTGGNQRMFSDNDVEIVKQAAKLEDEGINLEGIRAILAIRKGERQ